MSNAIVVDALLKRLGRLSFHRSPLESVPAAGRNIWLVGKKAPLCAAAKDLAQVMGQPLILKQAEAMDADYKGSKKEVLMAAGDVLRKVTLLALPEAAGRCVTAVRPDVIAKQMHGSIVDEDVILAVGEDDVLAAGLAVARCLPPYSVKVKAKEASCNVGFHGCLPSEASIKQLVSMAESLRIAQYMVDLPPNVLQPTTFKELVLDLVRGYAGVSHTVIEGKDLEDRGYGLLYAVGKAAAAPPCLIVLTHEGTPSASREGQKGIALVGKGITFDTGGTALKSRDGMCGMKRDMGGAAGCFGAFLAMVKSGGLPSGQPLHCVLCVAENAIGSKAFLQDDILTAYSGLTVEINNTDAEGRLVLSDGVCHVAKNLNCDLIVDMATLTGAQGVSTGVNHATIIATDDKLERDVVAAGKYSGDMVHPGIFAPELLMHEFDSDFADLKNSVKNRGNAQASCAGLFMHHHLSHCGYSDRWLHIDMASPASDPLGGFATGWGVGLLCRYLSTTSSAEQPAGARL